MTDPSVFQKLVSFFKNVRLDPTTVLLTVLIIPVLKALFRIVRGYVKKWTAYLIDGVLYWLSRLVIHSLAAQLTLRRYCSIQLEKENKFVYVPSRYDVKVEIDRVFVTLTLDYQGRKQGTFNHRTLFSAGNRIRIVGDPGSGKSSLVKRVFRDVCRESTSKPSKAKLPILLELKNLEIPLKIKEEHLGEWFLKKLRELVEQTDVYKMGDCFDIYSKTSGLLILLDGLDEVSSSRYTRFQHAINSLSERLSSLSPENIVVLTMRTQFHQQVREAFRETLGQVLFIEPFSPTDIYEFLSHWPFGGNAAEIISTIYSELTDRPTLRDMCANPLVLAMYVAERQSGSKAVIPESRTEFYLRVTEELLIKRRLAQVGPGVAPGKLREQRERILGRLAYDHLLDPKQTTNSLYWADAMRIVKTVMQCDEGKAEGIFRELAKETGLISEERPGESFKFIHLTFCEFLAAYESVEGQADGWKRLTDAHRGFRNDKDLHTRSRLVEVIPFACGLGPRVSRPAAITDVDALGDHRLLARCFLETKAYEHPSWRHFSETTGANLLAAPENSWDEQWLRDLHLFNVVVRDAQQCSTHTPEIKSVVDLGDFYRALVSRQQNSLATLLYSYAAQDAAAAFRLADVCGLDLAKQFPQVVVSNCDQQPFFALVLQRALHEESRLWLWGGLLAEAGMQSRLVASMMFHMEPERQLKDVVARIPVKRRWMLKTLTGSSIYIQIITLGAFHQPEIGGACPLLEVLHRTPAPGSLGWKKIMYGPQSLVLVLVSAVGMTYIKNLFYLNQFIFMPAYFFSYCYLCFLIICHCVLSAYARSIIECSIYGQFDRRNWGLLPGQWDSLEVWGRSLPIGPNGHCCAKWAICDTVCDQAGNLGQRFCGFPSSAIQFRQMGGKGRLAQGHPRP